MAAVVLTGPALDDLRRAGPMVAALLLGRLRVLESTPEAGEPLVDVRTGYRVLDALDGAGRIVYDVGGEVVTVRELWVDGVRTDGDAYAEALEWMQAADLPEFVALARIVRRLSRATGTRPVSRNRMTEPVPDWLADALVRTAGVDALTVAAMDAVSAFDAWNAYLLGTT